MTNTRLLLAASLLALCACGASEPDSAQPPAAGPGTEPAAGFPGATGVARYPDRVLWGDTHLHTKFSQDAFIFGVTLGPEEAYRFARGEAVTASHGLTAQLERPLDFLVVADHAEGLGAMDAVMAGDPRLMKDPRLVEWRAQLQNGDTAARVAVADDGRARGWPAALNDPDILRTTWQRLIELGEAYNDPGVFTTLLGYEWTSWPGGSNLHRVVVFRDGADKAGKIVPFSRDDSSDPEDLWKFLAGYEQRTGGRVLAIPHNGNLSNGLMFALDKRDGTPMDRDYAERRARWERVVEVTQIKGDGETHPLLSPDDEFADYETWDKGNFMGVHKTDDMLPFEYARSALRLGLELEAKLGVNPFKFGMIGSTDSHTALATADENNFFGKHSGGLEPGPDRWHNVIGESGDQVTYGWEQAASGYAGVWANENTRAAIFDALLRKEVYATTGPRITVRFFGGWSFAPDDAYATDMASIGYSKGVPMGADLPASAGSAAPWFMVSALKDPLGANLDRIQIVKGWTDAAGAAHEKVYDVVWSDQQARTIGADGKLTPVGDTVNVKDATYANSIGAYELVSVWQDPDFDAAHSAFYYARVLEIPTPRWLAYDAARYQLTLPPELNLVTQERAYTSPIWYQAR